MVILRILLYVICLLLGIVIGYVKYDAINKKIAKIIFNALNRKMENTLNDIDNIFNNDN